MSQNVYLTADAFDRMKDELQFLKTKERARIAAAIAEARAQGDLSENAEYDAAKEEQGHLEARIAKLEDLVATARVVDERQIDTSKARILSKVKVRNLSTKSEHVFTLVAAQEADPAAGKISVASPIGKGLLGSEHGQKVEIKVPTGKLLFEVLDISR
ncbi:MAG: transcription elongation factor GreA [Rhodothermales bacterium]|nr:transcription elongation factor GreA [Rhodothermales bacterium]MCA0270188.1 transcription elongation factor GreA [Bacteroidota bacterium]